MHIQLLCAVYPCLHASKMGVSCMCDRILSGLPGNKPVLLKFPLCVPPREVLLRMRMSQEGQP